MQTKHALGALLLLGLFLFAIVAWTNLIQTDPANLWLIGRVTARSAPLASEPGVIVQTRSGVEVVCHVYNVPAVGTRVFVRGGPVQTFDGPVEMAGCDLTTLPF